MRRQLAGAPVVVLDADDRRFLNEDDLTITVYPESETRHGFG
jgi:hypothetical protein